MVEETYAAVYVSWATFKNAIEGLVQGVPNVIDRTAFPGLSGGVQSQLLAGLKFLGLINDSNKPAPALYALTVPDESARKQKLKEILEERYADLFALGLVNTTPSELNATIAASYNVSGDTRDKAIRFFLSAVTYVGVPVSRLFKQPGTESNGRVTRRRSSPRVRMSLPQNATNDDPAANKPSGTSRAVKLRSGGTLTLIASLDLFLLTAQDRAFVFGLIDELDAYEKGGEAPASTTSGI